jgi:ABC-type transport system substrate-binding protein
MLHRVRPRRVAALLVALTLFASLGFAPASGAKAAKKKATAKKKTTAKKTTATTALLGIKVSPGSGNGSAKDIDPKGVLRIALNLDIVAGGPHFDPTNAAQVGDVAWIQPIFGTLLRETSEGRFVPFMAKSVEVVDTQTVKIGLRPGVRFTDGWPYDAKAVADGLLRTRFQDASPAAFAGMNAAFRSLTTATVVDPLTVVLKMKDPVAGDFLSALASKEGAIVSPKQVSEAPGQIEKAPIGAGPYLFERFEPLQIISLRKNPNFFDASSWRLGGIDWVQTPNGPAGVNGLFSGTIDWATLATDTIDKVAADSRFGTASGFTEFAYQILEFCGTKPPFDDLNMRKALQVAIDRDQFNKLVYGGHGRPAYGFWPEGHPNFEPALKNIVKYDPAEAKRLFALAGVTPANPLTIPTWTASSTGQERAMEALQALLEPYGVKLTITYPRDSVSEFFAANKAGMVWTPGSRAGYDKYGKIFLLSGQQAICGLARGDVMANARDAASYLPDDPRAIAAYKKADMTVAQGAYVVPVVQVPTLSGWNLSKVGGTPQFGGAFARLLLDSIYIRK